MEYRLGPAIMEKRGGCFVRLADDYRKCVVFFGEPKRRDGVDEVDPWGTGFIVSAEDNGQTYLVTAWHVIEPYREEPFAIRYNDKSGAGRLEFINHHANWVTHPTDNTVDVAVLEIDIPKWADCVPYRQFSILESDRFESKDIGAGDLVYTVGLWKMLYGKKKNLPFVHVGHIGLVPEDERVPAEAWLPEHRKGGSKSVLIEAYLTEGEPLNGASGSPVFVRRSLRGQSAEGEQLQAWMYGSVWLLGLQSNAWFGKPGEDYQLPPGDDKIPRGINIVVPSMKINEVINQSKLKSKRQAQLRDEQDARAATKTDLRPTDESSNHREDFNSLLGAAARKQQSDDQT
jgi:hypothetical protein